MHPNAARSGEAMSTDEITKGHLARLRIRGAPATIPGAAGFIGEYSASEVQRQAHRSLVRPIEGEVTIPKLREAFARLSKSPGSSVIIEYRSRHRDGSWRWIEAIGTNLLAEPEVNAIVCNYQDITRRRQVEEAVVESEERFRVALKTSPVVLFNQDRDLRYTWIYNPSRGYSVDEVEGKTDAELLSAEDAERLTRIKRRVIETGTSAREEVELTSGGIKNVYDLNIEPMLDPLGEISGITCVALDITERKRAEERIRELGAIVESSEDAIFGRTLDGLITSWNKGAEKIYGYAENEVIVQPVSILVPVDRQNEAP